MTRLAFMLLALLGGAAAAQEGGMLRHRAPIVAPEGHAHYRVVLPARVYAGIEQRDMGDLRVLNAALEPVPHAFLPREPSAPAPVVAVPARLFPLYGTAAQGLEGVKLDVVRGASGTVIRLTESPKKPGVERRLLGYLVEIGKDEKPIEALELDWRTSAGFNGAARVEASDDLARWRILAHEAPILALEHAGERLERRRIELRGARAEYLRLSFLRVPEDFELRALRLERRGERVEPDREWIGLAAVQAGKAGEYRFEAAGRFPADRVRLALPQQNTVARVQILSRDDDEQPWRSRAWTTVYRLQRDGAAVTSPDVGVPQVTDRQWLVRVDARGGGLGAGALGLELGWVPHELVFAARGAGPFALAFGGARVRAEALAVATVVPGYEKDKAVPAQAAGIGEVVAAPPRPAFLADPAGWVREAMASGRGKTWILWLVLGLGVLVVAWMALRLLREVGGKVPPPPAA